MTAVELQGVVKRFGDVLAVDGVDLALRAGEFFTLLGPSGSGKTTCLRLVAGFELPDAGRILLHGEEVSNRPPYERDVNTVFQDYALFPHLSVLDNVAYGPRVRGVPPAERRRLAEEMLALVELPGIGGRRPAALSGGQRQRVALARALINRPRVLLLDEPLGALDLKLRQQMQLELKAIQRRLGITFLFVTHDQDEALAMSDRIAVFRHGRIAQIGTPAEIYESPATAFVAGFVGAANLLDGALAERLAGSSRPFALRPEKLRLAATGERPPTGWRHADGVLRDLVYLGSQTRYAIALEGGGELVVVEQNLGAAPADAGATGRRCRVVWDPRHERPLVAD